MAELAGTPVVASPTKPPSSAKSSAWNMVHTAALSAAAVGLLLLGVLTGRFVLAALIIPLQVLLALAWLAALGCPGLWRSGLLATGAGIAADFLLATGPFGVRRLAGVVGVSLLFALLLQLLRRDGRYRMTAALASTLAAVVFVVGLAVLVALRRSNTGQDATTAALLGTGTALFLSRLVDALRLRSSPVGAPRRSALGLVVGGAAAVGVGALVGLVASGLGVGDGIALATASAAVALATDLGLDIARRALPAGAEHDRA